MARVTVGLPVHNGERFIGEALEALLAQSFADFEIIISDNASSDETERICRDFAGRDPRVKYHRNRVNIGAAANFNRTFELASSEYFKWAAHDDRCAPDLLSRCVEVLDRDPGAILCYSKARVIDFEGRTVRDYDFPLAGDRPQPQQRFRRQIRSHQCYEVFGLTRAAALRAAGPLGGFAGGDAVLLLRLCLMGRFVELPDVLFFPRSHGAQSMALRRNILNFAAWFDPRNKGRIVFPYWRILAEYVKTVRAARRSGELTFAGGAVCRVMIAGWAARRAKCLALDVLAATVQSVRRPEEESARPMHGVADQSSAGQGPAG